MLELQVIRSLSGKMKVLLVEDDPKQLLPLQIALSRAGHSVDGVKDGETAQWLLSEKDYDLLVLDWMLPHVSGVNLCQHYRALGKTAPVLMITARDTTVEKVRGLDAGADDYLVKPIDLIEFMARVRALRRRSPLWVGDMLTLEDLSLQLDSLTVEKQGKSVTLSSREFQLLEHFMRHPRQILTRDQIEQAVWEWGTEPDSNAMTVLVRKLRQRLQAVEASDWVESIYGMGYRLSPPED
jgi:two-component system, OmpR family, manganese sensing response regulator